MKKIVVQRVLSAILCAAMVFHSVSYETMASEANQASEASQTIETAYEVQSEEDYLDTVESQEDLSDESGEKTSDNEPETSTEDEEEIENTTEAETETETETETEAIETYEEAATFTATFDPVISFTGFAAVICEDTKITIANSENYSYAYFYLLQYNGDKTVAKNRIYFDNDNNDGVYTKSYDSNVYLCDETTDVELIVELKDSEYNIIATCCSTMIARTNKYENVEFTISDVTPGISKLDAVIDYTGDMKFSSDNTYAYFYTKLYYQTVDNEDEWKSVSGSSFWAYMNKDTENHTISFSGLEGGKTYHGKIEVYMEVYGDISDGYLYAYKQEIKIDDFTTIEDVNINFKDAFPDEMFRTLIAKNIWDSDISASDDTIAKSELENITYIYSNMAYSSSKTTSAITDITGIELLTNLTSASFEYHEIGDISKIEWKKLSKLETLDLRGNNLTSVPDFSSNTNLKWLYLNENMLSDATISRIEVPSECYVNTDDQRLNGFDLVVEDNYYLYNGTLHLFVKLTGYKRGFSNSIKFYIKNNGTDGEYEEIDMDYGYSYYYNRDAGLPVGSYTIKAELTIDGCDPISIEHSFNVVEQSVFTEQSKYYLPITSENDLSLAIYTDKMDVSVQKVELVDKDGKVYAEDEYKNTSSRSNDPRYTKISYYAGSDILNYFYVNLARIKNSIPVGTYSVRITYTNGAYDTLDNIVEVTSGTVITSISGGYDYDMTGNYIFLLLIGDGINPEKLDYSFTYKGTEYKAKYVSSKKTYSGVVVKLEKDSKMPRNNNMSVIANISGDGVYIPDEKNYLYLQTGIFWLAYNKGTNQFETGISAILGREGTVEAELWSDYKYSDGATKLATSTSSLNSDGIAYFTFKNNDGNVWTPTGTNRYYVYCTYNGTTNYETVWINIDSYSTSINYWSGDSEYLEGTGDTTFCYYEGAEYKSSDKYESSITGGSLITNVLSATVGTFDSTDNTTGTKVVGISQKFNLSKLGEGSYEITLKKNNEVIATKSFQILPNYFILNSFSASWQDENTISIYLNSPNYVENDDNYVVTLTDPYGNDVNGLKTTLNSGYANSCLYLNVTGLNRADAYKKYYIKVTHKKLGDAKTKDSSGDYVNYFTGEKGEYKTISSSSKGGFTGSSSSGVYRVQGIYTKNLTYPITLTVYRPYDASKILDLTINAANSEKYYYYWSADQVYNKLPDKNDLYDLVAVDADGNAITYNGALISYRTTSSSTWTIMTSNSQLKVGDTATITVKGNKATPKFTSSNTKAVTVTSKGNVATLTAVGSGTSDITITADNISRQVTITVIPEVISSIDFDKTELTVTTVDSGTLSILADKANAWDGTKTVDIKSSDESIVTVATASTSSNPLEIAKVTVTGLKPGTATITAIVEGLEPVKATVTVNGVFTEEEKTAEVEKVGKFYVNLNSAKTVTLEDVVLPKGWTWVKPETKLTTNKTGYPAIYKADNQEAFTSNITVYSYKISNVTLTGSDKINVNKSQKYELSYDYTGTIDPELKAVWSSSDSKALQIISSDNEKAEVKATATGTQQLNVTVGDVTATLDVAVYSENSVIDIKIDASMPESNGINFISSDDGKIYVDEAFIGEESNSILLTAKGYTSTSLKWESSNPDVAEITELGNVTVKAAGTTVLTVTVGDIEKYSKDIELIVGDFAPNFDGTKVTLYSKTSNASLPIYANAVNPVTEVKVNGSDNIEGNLESGKLVIYVNTDKLEKITKKTKEKVTFTLITELGEYTTNEVAVTIDTTVPSVNFKQSAKLNVFYKSGEVSFSVTSKNQIEDITFEQDNGGKYFDSVTFNGSMVTLKTREGILTSDIGKNGIGDVVLNIKFKDYGTLKYNLKVATEYKAPSLSINNANIVAGQKSFTTDIVDKKTKKVVSEISTVKDLAIKGKTTATLSGAEVNNGKLTVKYEGSANANYTINVTSDEWTGTVALTGKVTYVKSPKAVLGSSALTITTLSRTSIVPVSIKDSSEKIKSATVSSKKTDSNLNVYFDAQLQSIVAEYNKNATISKGYYSYTLTPITENGTTLNTTTFKVNVVVQVASVQLKTKGSINLINANEYMTLTPVLKYTTAKVESIKLTGDYAKLFIIESLGDGTYKLAYDDEVVAGLEAIQYKLPVKVSLDDGTTVESELKVKPVIKLPTVKADVTKGVLYRNSDKTVVANLTTTSKTGSNAIERIEIATDTKKHTDEYFNVEFVANKVDASNGTIKVSIKDKNIPKGNYTVTCKVYYETGAISLSEKNAATVKFTITVK